MEVTQQQFAKDVIRKIFELCKMIYNLHSDDEIEAVFGASREQIENIVARTVNAMPVKMFNQATKSKIQELEEILAKEFIFFQVQEKINDPQYQNDLANFILLFSRDINNRLGSEGVQ